MRSNVFKRKGLKDNIMKKQVFLVSILTSIFLASCTSTIELQMLQPADLFMPEHLQTIALADRSRPSKGFNNVVEGLITGEGIGQDRRGRMRALEGLARTLTRTPRFDVKSTNIEMEGSPAGNSFPAPLPWAEVSPIEPFSLTKEPAGSLCNQRNSGRCEAPTK